jgi:uncharacterized membrane protein
MDRKVKFDNINNDPGFYRLGIFYFNKRDSRFMVPKATKLGYTVNFARPYAYIIIALIILISILTSYLH